MVIFGVGVFFLIPVKVSFLWKRNSRIIDTHNLLDTIATWAVSKIFNQYCNKNTKKNFWSPLELACIQTNATETTLKHNINLFYTPVIWSFHWLCDTFTSKSASLRLINAEKSVCTISSFDGKLRNTKVNCTKPKWENTKKKVTFFFEQATAFGRGSNQSSSLKEQNQNALLPHTRGKQISNLYFIQFVRTYR